jgi:CubicO group peptidase (beta-lactamase class C family)
MDYARFCQMLLNGGELDGVRLLSPTTVKLMSMDHAGKIGKQGAPSFGLGFFVDTAESGFSELTSEGTFGWGGFWYTQFFIAPEEEMIGVFMAQLQPTGGLRLESKFKGLAHQAIVE